jgi:hypothetical protein
MLKLKINTNSWQGTQEFEVSHLQYEVDEKGYPVDIVVVGKEETLKEISEFAQIGCNMQPISPWAYPWNIAKWELEGATHEMLIARLPEFTVEGNYKVHYQAF